MDPLAAPIPAPTRFVLDAARIEALERLQYVVERRRSGVLIGPAGSGKSTLLGHFARTLRRSGRRTLMLNLVGADSREFLRSLGAGLGLGLCQKASAGELRSRVFDFAAGASEAGENCVLILDHLDRAEPHVVRELERFRQLAGNGISLLIAVRPDCSEPVLTLCRELSVLRIEMDSMSTACLRRELKHSVGRILVTESAAQAVAEAASGRLDRLLQVCELLELAITCEAPERIDSAFVRDVLAESA